MSFSVRNNSQHQSQPAPACGDESDVRLLQRFVKSRCDLAFAQLVERHGAPVMGVCRRVLSDAQEAEDAFQATFLVLARKASVLRTASSLPAWLHKTAFRIAIRARAHRLRRKEQPLQADTMLEQHPALLQIAADHERSALDEELNRLPEKLRLPLFLCCVEGKSRDEAAAQLGWSLGSLKGRLERGRQLLRRRLTLRGVSFSVALMLWLRTQETAQAALTPSLVAATVQAGTQVAAGGPAMGYVSQNALNLAQGSFHIMTLSFAKSVVCALTMVGLLSVGSASLTMPSADGDEDRNVLDVAPTSAAQVGLTFVALLDDQEQSDRPREGDRPRERDGERERAGQRERDGDREREGDRPREGQRDRDVQRRPAERDRAPDFRPQTDREAALFRMIQQLRGEVAELRRALQARGDDQPRGERERVDVRRREGDNAPERVARVPELERGWERTKQGKVFKAYDRNGDLQVTLEEWYAMKEGLSESDTERRKLEADRFKQADPNSDGKMTAPEFLYWYTKGRYRNTREGNPSRERETDRPRDGRERETRRDSPEAERREAERREGERREGERE